VTLDEIKSAVEAGETVHWASTSYRVIKDSIGRWLVKCDINNHCVGLTHRDGTLSDEERMFFRPGDPLPPSWEERLDERQRVNR
jgi:hypothetical protein